MWISKREYNTLRREHDDAVAADAECEAEAERYRKVTDYWIEACANARRECDELRGRVQHVAKWCESRATDLGHGGAVEEPRLAAQWLRAVGAKLRADLAPTKPAEPLAPPSAAPNNVAAHVAAVQVQREVANRPRPCKCGAPYGIACYCEHGKEVTG